MRHRLALSSHRGSHRTNIKTRSRWILVVVAVRVFRLARRLLVCFPNSKSVSVKRHWHLRPQRIRFRFNQRQLRRSRPTPTLPPLLRSFLWSASKTIPYPLTMTLVRKQKNTINIFKVWHFGLNWSTEQPNNHSRGFVNHISNWICFEGKQIGSAGPELAWKLFEAYRKADNKVRTHFYSQNFLKIIFDIRRLKLHFTFAAWFLILCPDIFFCPVFSSMHTNSCICKIALLTSKVSSTSIIYIKALEHFSNESNK